MQADKTDEATRLLAALMTMADPWKNHPDFPAAALVGQAAHAADTTLER
ncbi:hypothetical protein ACWGRV_33995 [Streptomyces sp. NPDC055663]